MRCQFHRTRPYHRIYINPATREFSGVLDDKLRIKLLAYTVETLMAEKVQSILKRGVATTRPRDFYDLHMLVHRGGFDGELFAKALQNTIETRNSDEYLKRWKEIVDAIAASAASSRKVLTPRS